jgi:hypothetical protein
MSDSNEAKKPWHHPSYGGMSESSAKASWEASRDRTERWIAAGRLAPPPVGNILSSFPRQQPFPADRGALWTRSHMYGRR